MAVEKSRAGPTAKAAIPPPIILNDFATGGGSPMVRSVAENAARTDLPTLGLAGESGAWIGPMWHDALPDRVSSLQILAKHRGQIDRVSAGDH